MTDQHITIFIPGQPTRVTAQQKGVDFKRKRFYEKPEVRAAREALEWQLRKHAPKQPMDGPVKLDVVWFYKTNTKKQDGAYKITRPDTDNLVKMLKDAMGNVGFFHDDAQVVEERTSKRWALIAGTYITIETLPQKVEDGT